MQCPTCGLDDLEPGQLFAHYSLFHVSEAAPKVRFRRATSRRVATPRRPQKIHLGAAAPPRTGDDPRWSAGPQVTEPSPDASCPLCGLVCRSGKGFVNFAGHLEEAHEPEGTDEDGDKFLSSGEIMAMAERSKVAVSRHQDLAPGAETVADPSAA